MYLNVFFCKYTYRYYFNNMLHHLIKFHFLEYLDIM